MQYDLSEAMRFRKEHQITEPWFMERGLSRGALFKSEDFVNVNWKNLKIISTQFYACRFNNALLEDLEIYEATFEDCYFNKTSFLNPLFQNCKFIRCTFEESLFECVGSTLTQSSLQFERCWFSESRFQEGFKSLSQFHQCEFSSNKEEEKTLKSEEVSLRKKEKIKTPPSRFGMLGQE